MIRSVPVHSIGSAVPRPDFDAAVHSVFRNSINLKARDGGVLITLILSRDVDLPQGIRLNPSSGHYLQGLTVGAPARCRDDILTIGDALVVDLHPARPWPADLSKLNADMANPAVMAAWQTARQALDAWPTSSSLSNTPCRGQPARARHSDFVKGRWDCAVRGLLRATAGLDLAGIASVSDLIGLGEGLTPAGDDFLVGFLAGLWCTTRGRRERGELLSALGALISQYAAQTNDIARTYLLLAARGQVSSRVLDLASEICGGEDTASVRGRAEAALSIGHSSGVETVNGLLMGLAAWECPGLLELDSVGLIN